MRSLLLLIALLAVLVAAAATGYKSGARGVTQSTWSTGFGLSGETLRLNSDGTYILQPWGDLPPYEPHFGYWHRRGNTLALVQAEPTKRTRLLHYKAVFGCKFLLTEKINRAPRSVFPSGITGLDFFQAGTGCDKRIEAYNGAHSVAP